MKNAITIIIILLLFFGGGLIGCSDVDQYEIIAMKDHDTYMISRQGEISVSEEFDTIFVFGHIDNRLIAEEITEYFNKNEMGKPFQYRRFLPGEGTRGTQ